MHLVFGHGQMVLRPRHRLDEGVRCRVDLAGGKGQQLDAIASLKTALLYRVFSHMTLLIIIEHTAIDC